MRPQTHSMRLHDQDRSKRRSVADALVLLQQQEGYNESVEAIFRTRPLPLPTDASGSLVQLQCEALGIAVSMPTSTAFEGMNASGAHERLAIEQLHDARVDALGNVQLTNERRLRAVSFVPARQMEELTGVDWKIVHAVIAFTGIAVHCYRYVDIKNLPNVSFVDFQEMQKVTVLGLKDFLRFLVERKGLHVERKTVTNTLKKCGIKLARRGRS